MHHTTPPERVDPPRWADLLRCWPRLADLDRAALAAGESGQPLDPIRVALPPMSAADRLAAHQRLAASYEWGADRRDGR